MKPVIELINEYLAEVETKEHYYYARWKACKHCALYEYAQPCFLHFSEAEARKPVPILVKLVRLWMEQSEPTHTMDCDFSMDATRNCTCDAEGRFNSAIAALLPGGTQ